MSSSLSTSSNNNTIELIVSNYIRIKIEKQNKHIIVPSAIKILIGHYCQQIIPCNFVLNIATDLKFYNLLINKLNCIISFKFLYRASQHNFLAKSFHTACDGEANKGQIVIIQSNHGNIFGGYYSVALKSPGAGLGWIKDDKAFLFLIKSSDEKIDKYCPMIFDIKPNHLQYAVVHNSRRGPMFGWGKDIFIDNKCNTKRNAICPTTGKHYSRNSSELVSYWCNTRNIDIPIENNWICGGNEFYENSIPAYFDVIEYEVFQVITK